jgi:hypothetical protein
MVKRIQLERLKVCNRGWWQNKVDLDSILWERELIFQQEV